MIFTEKALGKKHWLQFATIKLYFAITNNVTKILKQTI